jgi:hypothetical protein
MMGLHGLTVVWAPLVIGIGAWLATRTGKEGPSEEEETTEESEER